MPVTQLRRPDTAPVRSEPVPDSLRGRVIRLEDVSLPAIEQWQSLARRAVEPNPFFEPEFALAASRHLDGSATSLLVVEDAHRWHACMPIQSARLRGVLPIRRSRSHPYCFLGTPLLDGTTTYAAARALLKLAVSGRAREPVLLEDLADDGPAAAAIRLAAEDLGLVTLHESRRERALLRRRADGGYLDGMPSHRRRELNRLGRRLEAELGGSMSVTDEAADAGSYDAFLALEASGWKGRSATALGSDPAHAAFFGQICESFGARDRLELLCLRVGDRLVAMKCNLYAGDGGFCFKIAYDEELARFSPGVQLERENVRVFAERRSELWQDSCADPENTMINRLWPDRRSVATILLTRSGVRASALRRGIAFAEAVQARERKRPSPRS